MVFSQRVAVNLGWSTSATPVRRDLRSFVPHLLLQWQRVGRVGRRRPAGGAARGGRGCRAISDRRRRFVRLSLIVVLSRCVICRYLLATRNELLVATEGRCIYFNSWWRPIAIPICVRSVYLYRSLERFNCKPFVVSFRTILRTY